MRLSILFLFFLALVSAGFATTNLSACGTINARGDYTLNTSLTTIGTCLSVNNNSVSIDCKGYSITGDGGSSDHGIDGLSTFSNITVKNCVIIAFGNAIATPGSINVTIQNNSISQGTASQIVFSVASTNLTIINNSISGGTRCIRLWTAATTKSNISDNICHGQTTAGLSIEAGSNGNVFSGNMIYNESIGINLIGIGTNNNTFTNNFIYNTTTYINTSTANATFNNMAFGYSSTTGIINWTSFTLLNTTNYVITEGTNVMAQQTFVSLNDTALPALNNTAAITISTDAGCSNRSIIVKSGFPTSLADILVNGSMNGNATSSCMAGLAKFTVPSFSGYALGTGAFVVSIISPADASEQNTSPLSFSWNATGSSTTYFCNVSINGSVAASNVVTSNGTTTSTNLNPSSGNHTWNVTCLAGIISNSSSTWSFNYTTPPSQGFYEVSNPYFSSKYIRHNISTRCFADVEPSTNVTARLVLFTVTMQNGSVFNNSAGTQTSHDRTQWYSQSFTPIITDIDATNPGKDEEGWINCSVYVVDTAFNTFTTSTKQYFGYPLQSACNTTDNCTLGSGLTRARGYYFYDDITLPANQAMTIIHPNNTNRGYAYFVSGSINFLGNITSANTTRSASTMLIDATNITFNSNTTLNGATNSSACGDGYNGGSLTFQDFTWLNISGNIWLNGGTPANCNVAGTDGGHGGDTGSLSFLTPKAATIVITSPNISITAGNGAKATVSTTDAGFGGYGGNAGGYCFYLNGDAVLYNSGNITCSAGNGGVGGNSSGSSSYHAGDGGTGGDAAFFIRSSGFYNSGNILVSSGIGGNGGNGSGGGGSYVGSGEDGGVLTFNFFDGNTTAASAFINSGIISFTPGNGGNIGGNGQVDVQTGGYAYCVDGNSCNYSIYLDGNVNITNNVTLTPPTCGSTTPAGCAPAIGAGWKYYFQNGYNLSGNNFTKFQTNRTNMSSTNGVYPVPSSLTINLTGNMIRTGNLTLDYSADVNTSSVYLILSKSPAYSVYASNQSLSMHRQVNGTYTAYGVGSNGKGNIITASSSTANVSYANASLACAISPVPSTNLSTKTFTVSCNATDTGSSKNVWLAGVWAIVNGTETALTQATDNLPYSYTNTYYLPAGVNLSVVVYYNKSDYPSINTTPGNVSFQSFIIDLPPSISSVKSICLFPTQYYVKPVGESYKYGIFRLINLNSTSKINASLALNETMPDNITQWITNTSATSPLVILINSSAQRVKTNLNAFDGTQNVSNYSAYLWLFTNCTGVNITSNVSYPRDYVWSVG
jgi:hypothetical protein